MYRIKNNKHRRTAPQARLAKFNKQAIALVLLAPFTIPLAYADTPTLGFLKSGLGDGKEFDVGDATLTIKGALSAGSVIRADNPDPNLIGAANVMGTLNDGDQNYKKNDPVSTALEGYLQADLHYRDYGMFISAKGWYDYTLENHSVPHGNMPNGYQANTPLSDAGFVPLGKFTNVVLDDAYVYGHFTPAGMPLEVRFGNQTIPWSTPSTMGSGLQQVNAVDYAALSRSSSIAEEAGIPALSLYGKLDLTPKLSVDGFYQFNFQPNAYPGCGTFYSTSDYVQPGCNILTLNGALLSGLTGHQVNTTDAQSIENPLDFATRSADRKPNNGQFGLSTHYLVDSLGLFGLYAANIDSKSGFTGMQRNGPGILTPALANLGMAVPTGLSSQYFRSFPSDLHLFGVNFKTRLPDQTGLYAELTYVPNQPIAWNGADYLNGLLTGQGPLGYLNKMPVGSASNGYDRFKVSQLILGATKPLGTFLGGQANLSGEMGLKYVAGLPDPNIMRYGRVGWGTAPSVTSPTCTGTAATCAMDGFVTTSAYGARAKLEDSYASVVEGLDLTPAVTVAYDIKGYSYDGIFSQGRTTGIFSLSGVYKKTYVFQISYVKTGGGTYNIVSDRSTFAVSVGARL